MRPSTKKDDLDVHPGLFPMLDNFNDGASPADAGFPDKPIKIVVPFAAGGSLDVVARPLADFLSKDLARR